MDNMETDLRRCIEHVKHVHREIEQVEKEVSEVLEKYEKAKAYKAFEQRRVMTRPVAKIEPENAAAKELKEVATFAPETGVAEPAAKENAIPAGSAAEVKENATPATPVAEVKKAPVKKEIDFERTVGKVLMGVFASVLVFVSLLVFAIWAVPKFGDTTKMILMYAISILIAGVGLLLLIKDKSNKWFLSLAACGMGALYISFLVTRLHFGVISDVTLYILFFVWGIAVCLLSRLRSVLFLVIGQIGMFLSTVLGVFYALQGSDGERLLSIVIFFVIAETVFCASHYKREFRKNAINLVALLLSLIPLAIACSIKMTTNPTMGVWAAVLLVVVLLVMMILFTVAFKHETVMDGIAWLVVNFACMFSALLPVHIHFNEIGQYVIIVLVLFIVGVELVRQIKNKEKQHVCACMDAFNAVLLSVALVEWLCCKNLRVYTGVAPLAIATLIYGYLGKRVLYKAIGFVLAILCIMTPMNAYCYVVQGFAVAITLTVLQMIRKEQYSTIVKMVSYPLFLVFLIIGFTTVWEYKLEFEYEPIFFVIILGLISFVNILSSKWKALFTNLSTGKAEEIFRLETGIIHLVLMAVAITEIVFVKEPGPHGIAVFIGFFLFAVNTYEIIDKAGVTWGSLITCVKTVFLFVVILWSFEQTDNMLSVVVLVLALVFLIVGFVVEYVKDYDMKPTRIMGLVLTMLSTIKLLLVDIYVENKLFLAVNLFIGGLVCFAISFLYNILDKKISKK